MKSYPLSSKSSIRLAWHLKVHIRALEVDRKRVNCANDETLSLHQVLIQSAGTRQNSGLPSSFFAAWPKMLFEN